MFTDRMSEFEKNLQQPGAKETNTTVRSLAAEFSSFKTFAWKSLGMLKSQIELLVQGLDRMDTHSRRKVLLFHGIEEDKDEDVVAKTLAIITNQMRLPSIDEKCLETCHRLGTKKQSGQRPVLVRFTLMQHRTSVWKTKTALKGSKLTLTEFLTKSRQDVFVAARSHFGVKKCWSSEGTIVILLPDNTRMKIYTMAELQHLAAKWPSKRTTEASRVKSK